MQRAADPSHDGIKASLLIGRIIDENAMSDRLQEVASVVEDDIVAKARDREKISCDPFVNNACWRALAREECRWRQAGLIWQRLHGQTGEAISSDKPAPPAAFGNPGVLCENARRHVHPQLAFGLSISLPDGVSGRRKASADEQGTRA